MTSTLTDATQAERPRLPHAGPSALIPITEKRQPDGAHWPTGHRQAYEAA
jgi:hypothetical protein